MNPDGPVYNFQNQLDPIPRLDMNGLLTDGSTDPAAGVTNITVPHSGSILNPMHSTPWYTHTQTTYKADIAELQNQSGTSQATQDLRRMNEEFGEFFVGKTTSYNVEFGREVEN